jgi:hypothetical protein
VKAAATLRGGGTSVAPYASLNLGVHVGDRAAAVAENRRRLRDALDLPAEPTGLAQVHGTGVIDAAAHPRVVEADGSRTRSPGIVCAVLTADCLPLLLCARDGTEVAALHCGWRGLAGGMIEAGLNGIATAPEALLAWLGPAISGPCYEVGEEVRSALLARYPGAGTAFSATRPGHFHADLYAVARHALTAAGVGAISGGDRCTYSEIDAFFSHRRDGNTGRIATLIWLSP